MSSPVYLAVCCLDSNVTPPDFINIGRSILTDKNTVSSVSITFSVLALLVVILLVIQRKHRKNNDCETVVPVPTTSANWIVISSTLTTCGILLRATIWRAGFTPNSKPDGADAANSLCIVLSVVVQYFSLCISFCYLVYGIEVFTGESRHGWYKTLDIILGWIIPAAMCGIGAWAVYFPKLTQCYVMSWEGRLVAYVTLLSPVFMVLILCPVLLYKAAVSVKRSVRRQFGCYTRVERQIVSRVRIKYLLLMLVYVVCLLPNILGSVMVNAGDSSVRGPLEVLWSFTATLNSVHCFLVMLVIHGWPFSCRRPYRIAETDSEYWYSQDVGINRNMTSSGESEPLLS
ncbi:hypothetical protein ScPMuIL_006721 [Solemya velum]